VAVLRYAYDAYGLPRLFGDRCVLTGGRRCDANCDGVVDSADIDAFVLALTNRPLWEATYGCDYYCANDANRDGAVDTADIDALVGCIVAGGCGPEQVRNPYYFTGRRLDVDVRDVTGSVTGQAGRPLLVLYDYRAREYDPWHGRFCQRDPAHYAESLNLYQYVLSNPQGFTDPTGRFALMGFMGRAASAAWSAYEIVDIALGVKGFAQALVDLLNARSATYDAYLAVGLEGASLLGDTLLGPVDEVVGLARGMRAVRAAKAGKNVAEWTTKELGDAIKSAGSIEDFLKAVGKTDFDQIWSDKSLRHALEGYIRRQAPGHHHWVQLSMLPQLMGRTDKAFWLDRMFRLTQATEAWHDVHRSTRFHNELRAVFREGMSFDEYMAAIARVAQQWDVKLP